MYTCVEVFAKGLLVERVCASIYIECSMEVYDVKICEVWEMAVRMESGRRVHSYHTRELM